MKKKMKSPAGSCCLSSKKADTGLFSKGHHNHGQSNTAHHAATGKGFRMDQSTTKSVQTRMKALGVD